MYGVLEKLRANERVEGKDREIFDQGLIGILRDLYHQIDAAVAEAYGWPADLSDDEILRRPVDLRPSARQANRARPASAEVSPGRDGSRLITIWRRRSPTVEAGKASARASAP